MLSEPFEARLDEYENVDVSNLNDVVDLVAKAIEVAVHYREERVEIIAGIGGMLM